MPGSQLPPPNGQSRSCFRGPSSRQQGWDSTSPASSRSLTAKTAPDRQGDAHEDRQLCAPAAGRTASGSSCTKSDCVSAARSHEPRVQPQNQKASAPHHRAPGKVCHAPAVSHQAAGGAHQGPGPTAHPPCTFRKSSERHPHGSVL